MWFFLFWYCVATRAWILTPLRTCLRSERGVLRPPIMHGREVSLEDLQDAVGGGRGMAAKRKERKVHKSKYGNQQVKKDPWSEALERAAEERRDNQTPLWKSINKIFEAGANSTSNFLDKGQSRHRRFDGRDPETFGFIFCGSLIGAHGVRGSIRVDAPADRALEDRLTTPGTLYLLFPGRRAPRPVRLNSGRRLRSLGANVRYVLSIAGLEQRDVARALAGAQLYMTDDLHLHLEDEDTTNLLELEGAAVFDLQGQFIGTVFDVLDPTPESGLAQRLLQLDLGPFYTTVDGEPQSKYYLDERRRHCYVPLAEPILHDYDTYTNTITLDPPPGLLDLDFIYEPPPAIIRGFLPPPRGVKDEVRTF
mmetsp:Transcript_21316/g.27586  ORF Transcript_21316/g.27586 Transcript_21316/m.27586 type:complete len:365 (+) Transcript_21316:6-1100(+)